MYKSFVLEDPSTQPIRKSSEKNSKYIHQKLISSIQQNVHTDSAMETHEEVPKHQSSNAILRHQRE
jgi:uncharacterized membrane protein YgaE (UPF0421/DUF939 family)